MTKEYQEAFTEVITILDNYPKSEIEKIPKKLIEFFKENSLKEYEFFAPKNKEIKDLNIKNETKGILAIIYRNYLCNPEERKEYDKLLIENQKILDERNREKYNPDKIFEDNNKYIKNIPVKNDEALIEYKESLFKKIIKKIKLFFSKNKK